MTVPAYRAGTGSQPDSFRHAARAAVDDLFRLHAIGLVRFALVLVGDQATAEDVVQEAFLGLYRAWDQVRDPDAVLGYLRTAVVNGARSVHRSRGRARLLRVPYEPGCRGNHGVGPAHRVRAGQPHGQGQEGV